MILHKPHTLGVYLDNLPVRLEPIRWLSRDLRSPKRKHIADALMRRLKIRFVGKVKS